MEEKEKLLNLVNNMQIQTIKLLNKLLYNY